MTNVISRDELKEALEKGDVVLLEALPPEYFNERHLPGAQNLPLDDVDELAPKLIAGRDTPVVVYCSDVTCSNSKVAATRLEELGYTNVRTYEAGKRDWTEAGLATVSEPAAGR